MTRQEEAEGLSKDLEQVVASIASVGRALQEQKRISRVLLTEVRRLREVNAQLIARTPSESQRRWRSSPAG